MASVGDLAASLWAETIGSSDYFAETVTVQDPAGGPLRAVVCAIDAQTVFHGDQQGNEDGVDRIVVMVGRDESSATTPGIATPELGLRLWRAESADPDRRPFVFSGERHNVEPDRWELVFTRHRQTAQSLR